MLPWTQATTTMRRILLTNSPYWRNTLSALDVLSRQKLSVLDFGTLKTKRLTVYTLVSVVKRFARNAEEETLYNK
jgi:hypothetical protein